MTDTKYHAYTIINNMINIFISTFHVWTIKIRTGSKEKVKNREIGPKLRIGEEEGVRLY